VEHGERRGESDRVGTANGNHVMTNDVRDELHKEVVGRDDSSKERVRENRVLRDVETAAFAPPSGWS